jgi:hypothetical protein
MPAPQFYAKGIENVSITAVGTTIPYINIAFDVKENYNNTGAYDSYYQYSYYLPIAETSMTLVSNLGDSYTDLFEVTSGKIQISFANGEYHDITNDVPLDVAAIYGMVQSVLLA